MERELGLHASMQGLAASSTVPPWTLQSIFIIRTTTVTVTYIHVNMFYSLSLRAGYREETQADPSKTD
jgi:hypothetical protein